MGPGPSCVASNVYTALSKPTLGHLDPSFIKIMDSIKEYLMQLMGTKNKLTIPVSGTKIPPRLETLGSISLISC